MKNIKIASIMVACLFISVSAVTMAGAEQLDGEIETEISEFIGIVKPTIKLENQSVQIGVDDVDGNYTVNETLQLTINVTDNSGRNESIPFIIPRYLLVSVFIVREINKDKVPLMPLRDYLKRLIPVRVTPLKGGVINLKEGDQVFNISMKFPINNFTMDNTYENYTMHTFVAGFLPGGADGIASVFPIVEHKKITLEAEYVLN